MKWHKFVSDRFAETNFDFCAKLVGVDWTPDGQGLFLSVLTS
jgi:hypothetical protein